MVATWVTCCEVEVATIVLLPDDVVTTVTIAWVEGVDLTLVCVMVWIAVETWVCVGAELGDTVTVELSNEVALVTVDCACVVVTRTDDSEVALVAVLSLDVVSVTLEGVIVLKTSVVSDAF